MIWFNHDRSRINPHLKGRVHIRDQTSTRNGQSINRTIRFPTELSTDDRLGLGAAPAAGIPACPSTSTIRRLSVMPPLLSR